MAILLIGFVVVILVRHHARVRDATNQLMHTANVLLSNEANAAAPHARRSKKPSQPTTGSSKTSRSRPRTVG